MHNTKEYKLADIDPFSILSSNEIESISLQSRTLTLDKGETLFSPMDNSNHLGVILSGSFNMIKLLSSGKELIIDKLGAGRLFGELICFSGKNYPAWIKAASISKVVLIRKEVLLTLFANQDFLVSFMNRISQKSLNLTQKVELLSLKRVEQKIAYYILNLGQINCPISKLAEFLGVTRESTSRAVNKMRKEGILNSTNDLENLLWK